MNKSSLESPDYTHTGIIAWFARNSVAANLLMFGIIVMGAISAFTIKKEFFPELPLNQISINVPYLGAAPAEVEEGVCIKIEEAIQDLEGIEEITSRAREGSGNVRVEIDQDYDVKDLLDQIKNRIDAISTFPAETEKPIIYELTTQNEVIWVQLAGKADAFTMKEYGKLIRDELLALPDVTQAELVGARPYEISIEVSEAVLREYGLTLSDVSDAVRRSSIDLPSGSIKTEGGEILLRTKGQAYTGDEFSNIVLRTEADGTRILVGDVAQVNDGFSEDEFFFYYDGLPSLGIRVYRVGDQSTLVVTNAVKKYVKEKQDKVPEGLQLTIWGDGSRPLRGRLNLMLKNMLFGGALVFLSLTLFLRFKLAFWVMMGLPVCFLGALWMMPMEMIDISINMITLFGFILVLGIVVDDAIVIGENVYTTVRNDGQSVDNVIRGAKDVAMAATFGVLTTIAAFTPLLMIPGVRGKIWRGIGMVVILCLIFSLIESKLILPAHLAHMRMKPLKEGEKRGFFRSIGKGVSDWLERFVVRRYRPLLEYATKYRYATFATFCGLLILCGGLLAGGLVRFVFFPTVPSDFVFAGVTMAQGTPAEVTKQVAGRIENALWELDEEIKAETGDPMVEHSISWSQGEITARFYVELTPSETRDMVSTDFVNRWRDKVGQIPGSTDVSFQGTIGGGGSALDFQLVGTNYEQLDAAADELKDKLASFDGVYDITDTFSAGKQEIKLKIKPEAEALGLTLADLARQVRYGFYGSEAQRIQRGKDEIRVMVRYPRDERRSIGDLESMRIRTPAGDEIPFNQVAEAEMGRGYSTITRIDRKRVINVRGDVDKSTVEPQKIVGQIRKELMPELLAKYPGVSYELEGESKDSSETLFFLMEGFGFALILIYALMAIPLKSYLKPLIIMSVIPFGVVGAIVGHFVMGLDVSILSMCGIIALAGVVVNDSLVMVDFVNKGEKRGLSKKEAVLEAGPARFRAILLTSLTTFCGLLPMLFERSLQAQFLIPMATSLAFGILFSTVITLFLVPCLYLILEDFLRFFNWYTKPVKIAMFGPDMVTNAIVEEVVRQETESLADSSSVAAHEGGETQIR